MGLLMTKAINYTPDLRNVAGKNIPREKKLTKLQSYLLQNANFGLEESDFGFMAHVLRRWWKNIVVVISFFDLRNVVDFVSNPLERLLHVDVTHHGRIFDESDVISQSGRHRNARSALTLSDRFFSI